MDSFVKVRFSTITIQWKKTCQKVICGLQEMVGAGEIAIVKPPTGVPALHALDKPRLLSTFKEGVIMKLVKFKLISRELRTYQFQRTLNRPIGI